MLHIQVVVVAFGICVAAVVAVATRGSHTYENYKFEWQLLPKSCDRFNHQSTFLKSIPNTQQSKAFNRSSPYSGVFSPKYFGALLFLSCFVSLHIGQIISTPVGVINKFWPQSQQQVIALFLRSLQYWNFRNINRGNAKMLYKKLLN